MNAEDYVHRIGRTGRAGRSGRAFTLVATKDDRGYLEAVEKLIGKPVDVIELGKTPDKTTAKTSAKTTAVYSPAVDSPAVDDAPTAETEKKAGSSSRRGRGRQKGNVEGELPMPPDCTGDSFKTTEHTPAFLLG